MPARPVRIASRSATVVRRRLRARRFAVRLQHARRRGQALLLRRLLGPSSWRCHPHAVPHPAREPAK